MKTFTYILSFGIILSLIGYIVFFGVRSFDSNSIKTSLEDKRLKSSDLIEYVNDDVVSEMVDDKEEKEEVDVEAEEVNATEEKEIKESDTSLQDVVVEEVTPVSDVLEMQTGSLSGYGPDCKDCSGYLASGLYVGDGNIYYQDSTYGSVRILSGDKSYPFGTIVRVKSGKIGEFLAIVLDRGGGVGFGKSHLFDLLYSSNSVASNYGVSYNTTFEILRYGY